MGAIAKAAVTAADTQQATAILVSTLKDGTLPALVSAYRPQVPILCFCDNAKLGRQLMIYRGIHPIVGTGSLEEAVEDAKKLGFVKVGDSVVYVDVDTQHDTATMKLVHVE
ncbi:pyruvate kinase [Fragilaria crotonensis]|nr:pyruvate kinase [Fragilaria crotonensis]